MTTALSAAQLEPAPDDVAVAGAALPRVVSYLARHPGEAKLRLLVEGNAELDALVVPRGAVELLAQILAHLAAGEGVSVVGAHAELTTQQAADLLNVSRPFLIGLLDAGEIEYRKVGKHRRVRAASLLGYLSADDRRRRVAADELTRLGQEMGLY